LAAAYLGGHDFSIHTRRAIRNDLRNFARWFFQANKEPFTIQRTTVRDVVDFRNCLRRERHQAVSTVNRALVTIRRFFTCLVEQHHLKTNPAKQVKEIRRQQLAPNGLDSATVRKLLRAVELTEDIRAAAIFHLLLYSGCRVGDLANLEMKDLNLFERSGSVCFRFGKGNKHRTVPLSAPARKAINEYLAIRPPCSTDAVFIGERGSIGEAGIRNLCRKYSVAVGVRLHPHVFRHTFAKQFLADNGNDLVSLAQILGHENLQTTARYSQRSHDQLSQATDRLNY
jgi:integrase/recombinase XerC